MWAGQGSDHWGHWGDMERMEQYWSGCVDAALRVAAELLTGWSWLSWCRGGGEGRRRGCAAAWGGVVLPVVPLAGASVPGRQRCCAAAWGGPGSPPAAAGRAQELLC